MELAQRGAGLPFVRAAAQLGTVLVFAVLPLVLVPALLHAAGHDYLFDLRRVFLPAGRAILDGDSPYPHSLSELRSNANANYVYPPLAAVVMAPLTWLPQALAEGIFVALSLAAPALALWLLRVRDWRCYGLVYLWPPLIGGVSLGTFSPLLALAVAAAWRWRRSPGRLGAALAGATVVKLFLWPLFALLAAGDRRRAGLVSLAAAGIAALGSWALIGFAGLMDYPRLLGELSRVESPSGYGPTSLALAVGLPREAALACALALGLPLLVAAGVLSRRPGSELTALACAIAATLALSPVVWLHYLVLLLVPIAAAHRRLGLVWFAPLLFWVTPTTASSGSLWRIALVLAIATVTLVLAAAPPRAPRTAR
jgi:alpha-1,2-mannosyltransferase